MYEIQKDQTSPVNFFAGDYPVATAVREVSSGKSVKKYDPVKLVGGKVEPSAADSGSTTPAKTEYENTTAGIYGIAAGDAGAGEDVVVYLTGEFFADAINLPDSVTVETLTTAFRNIGIFLK